VFNGTLEATSEEEWDKTFDINVKSMFYTCKTCISMVSTPNNVTRSSIGGCLTLNIVWFPDPSINRKPTCEEGSGQMTYTTA